MNIYYCFQIDSKQYISVQLPGRNMYTCASGIPALEFKQKGPISCFTGGQPVIYQRLTNMHHSSVSRDQVPQRPRNKACIDYEPPRVGNTNETCQVGQTFPLWTKADGCSTNTRENLHSARRPNVVLHCDGSELSR